MSIFSLFAARSISIFDTLKQLAMEADAANPDAAGPDAILVPKVSGPDDLAAYEHAVAAAPARTALWAMIETPAAVLALDAIGRASAAGRTRCWVMGLNDLAKAMGGTFRERVHENPAEKPEKKKP